MKERETGERRGYDRQREDERSMDELFEREYYSRYQPRRPQENYHDKRQRYERASPPRYHH